MDGMGRERERKRKQTGPDSSSSVQWQIGTGKEKVTLKVDAPLTTGNSRSIGGLIREQQEDASVRTHV